MENLGDALRNVRLDHDCPLEEISRRTRISMQVLREMESGDFRSIRGGFYRQHFIREYLKALGEDPLPFLEKYGVGSVAAGEEPAPSLQAVRKLRIYRFRRRRGLGLALAVLLLAAAAYFLFASPGNPGQSWFVSPRSPLIAGTAFEPGWLSPGQASSEASWQRESLGRWLDRGTRVWGVVRAPATVHVRFAARCWAQVRRAGRIEASRVFRSGEELSAKGYDLQLSLGNPSVVVLMVNGKRESRFSDQTRPITFQLEPVSPFKAESNDPHPVP